MLEYDKIDRIKWWLHTYFDTSDRSHDTSVDEVYRWSEELGFWGGCIYAAYVNLWLFRSFIEKGKTVTANQLKMMEILPRIFYGVYECRFGYSFRVIQLLIYYGSAILSTDLQAIYMLIEMSVTSISSTERNKKPMSESENCEGVLILQSLVTKCGAVFPAEYWTTIIKCCLKKL